MNSTTDKVREVASGAAARVRRVTATTEVFMRGASCQMTIESKIAEETGLKQVLEESDPNGENPFVRQETDPENPGRIILEIEDPRVERVLEQRRAEDA